MTQLACMFLFVHTCPCFLLPRCHSSSPCKLSCSEPQRTLLSVELRILSFFNMLASMFLAFSKLCLSSISCLFFKFLRLPTVFQEFPCCNFLIFPTVSPIFLGFSKLAIHFSRMRSKGSRFTLGAWGLRVCSLEVAFTFATVHNRPQPSATVRVRAVWRCLW